MHRASSGRTPSSEHQCRCGGGSFLGRHHQPSIGRCCSHRSQTQIPLQRPGMIRSGISAGCCSAVGCQGSTKPLSLIQRVKAVVAVSPPLRLLFDPSRLGTLPAKVLLISGTRDWVVPSGPEAIAPMRDNKAAQWGHRLVLVQGADHFSLRSFRGEAFSSKVLGRSSSAGSTSSLRWMASITFSARVVGATNRAVVVDVSDRL